MGLIEKLEAAKEKKSQKKLRIVVVKAANEEVLGSIKRAVDNDLVEAILIDEKEAIEEQCEDLSIDLKNIKIIDEKEDQKAAAKGVELVRNQEADALMKGFIGTSDLLRAVVNKEKGIRASKLLSHVAVIDLPALDRLVAVTDGGMVVRPDKEELKTIIEHGVEVMQSIQEEEPKVALLSASENVMKASDASVWAKELTEEHSGDDYLLEGPISLDLSLDPEIAKGKNYPGKIQGDADIIVTPDIVSGNSLSKSLLMFADAKMAGLILGAKVPIILTSRTSSSDEKYASILLAQQLMQEKK